MELPPQESPQCEEGYGRVQRGEGMSLVRMK
jgi:hypothetical protein